MPSVKVDIRNIYNKEEVLIKLKNEIEQLANNYHGKISNFHIEWRGYQNPFQFRVSNALIKGIILVRDNLITVEAQIPLAFIFFKKQIENNIKQIGERILN